MSLSPPERLDLRGTPCPLNYIRTRLALEEGAAPVQGEFVPVRMTSPGREGMSAIPWKDPLTGKENPNA